MSHDPDPVPPGDSAGGAGLSGRDLIGLGGLLVGAIVVGTLLGLLVDHLAGTGPVFTVIGVALGMVAAAGGFTLKVRSSMHG